MLCKSPRKEQLHNSLGASKWKNNGAMEQATVHMRHPKSNLDTVRVERPWEGLRHSMHQVVDGLGRNALSEGTVKALGAELAYLISKNNS